jgi:hypothetical protein
MSRQQLCQTTARPQRRVRDSKDPESQVLIVDGKIFSRIYHAALEQQSYVTSQRYTLYRIPHVLCCSLHQILQVCVAVDMKLGVLEKRGMSLVTYLMTSLAQGKRGSI